MTHAVLTLNSPYVIIVGEWFSYSLSQAITNTFQMILITDGGSSYAIFIYKCGGMGWGGGVIGWQASSSNYVSHYLSGQADNNRIGCLYSDEYSAIIYRICMCETLTNPAIFISLTTLMSSIEITLNQPKTHNNYCVSVTSMSRKT